MPKKKCDIQSASLDELIDMQNKLENQLKAIEKQIAYERTLVTVHIENASVYLTQFAKDDQYGRKGSRFCVYIEDEDNVKELSSIGFKFFPDNHTFIVRIPPLHLIPRGKVIIMRQGNKDFKIDAPTIGVLNDVDIKHSDLLISPYYYEYGEDEDKKPFVIPYLKKGYFVVDDGKKDEKKLEKLKRDAELMGYSIVRNNIEKLTIYRRKET